jgi:hypothetical protein
MRGKRTRSVSIVSFLLPAFSGPGYDAGRGRKHSFSEREHTKGYTPMRLQPASRSSISKSSTCAIDRGGRKIG